MLLVFWSRPRLPCPLETPIFSFFPLLRPTYALCPHSAYVAPYVPLFLKGFLRGMANEPPSAKEQMLARSRCPAALKVVSRHLLQFICISYFLSLSSELPNPSTPKTLIP